MIEFAPDTPLQLTYDEAWLYCATLTHNNYYDWRIPTWLEAQDYYKRIHKHSWVVEDARLQSNLSPKVAFITTPVRTI